MKFQIKQAVLKEGLKVLAPLGATLNCSITSKEAGIVLYGTTSNISVWLNFAANVVKAGEVITQLGLLTNIVNSVSGDVTLQDTAKQLQLVTDTATVRIPQVAAAVNAHQRMGQPQTFDFQGDMLRSICKNLMGYISRTIEEPGQLWRTGIIFALQQGLVASIDGENTLAAVSTPIKDIPEFVVTSQVLQVWLSCLELSSEQVRISLYDNCIEFTTSAATVHSSLVSTLAPMKQIKSLLAMQPTQAVTLDRANLQDALRLGVSYVVGATYALYPYVDMVIQPTAVSLVSNTQESGDFSIQLSNVLCDTTAPEVRWTFTPQTLDKINRSLSAATRVSIKQIGNSLLVSNASLIPTPQPETVYVLQLKVRKQ